MKDFTLGIITYNSEKYLDSLFRSVEKGSLKPTHILIVDNGSTDNTLSILKGYGSKVEIITSEFNLGHSVAANTLLEKCKTEFLVLQDHDTEVLVDTYEKLLDRANNFVEDEVSVSAIINSTSKFDKSITYGHDLHYLVSGMVRTEYTSEEQNISPTTCVLIDLKKVGKLRFDEEMFIYQNDYDFFYRLRLLGYKLLVCKESIIIHKEGTPSVSGRKGSKYSVVKAYYINRNRMMFYLKNYSWKTLLILSPALLAFEFVGLVFSLRKGFIKEYLKAIRYIFSSRSRLLSERKVIQSSRLVDDSACLGASNLGLSESAVTNKLESFFQTVMEFCFKVYFNFIKGLF